MDGRTVAFIMINYKLNLYLQISPLVAQTELNVSQHWRSQHLSAHQLARAKSWVIIVRELFLCAPVFTLNELRQLVLPGYRGQPALRGGVWEDVGLPVAGD